MSPRMRAGALQREKSFPTASPRTEINYISRKKKESRRSRFTLAERSNMHARSVFPGEDFLRANLVEGRSRSELKFLAQKSRFSSTAGWVGKRSQGGGYVPVAPREKASGGGGGEDGKARLGRGIGEAKCHAHLHNINMLRIPPAYSATSLKFV